MLYFKHSELVNNYHVSLKTVHNWIDSAKKGKLDLKLYSQGSRTYVANTPGNVALIKKLVAEGKKYRNARHHKVVTPRPEFYELYTKRQILDIISNLKIHREIPRQYNYMDGGAASWDDLMRRYEKEAVSNLLKGTIELMSANIGALDLLLEGCERVNVIDVGVGNAFPVKGLLGHLLNQGTLHRYVAIDISPAMLDIAEMNIKKWFDNRIKFERHVRDIAFERFDDLLVDDMLNKDSDRTVNLVLLLGATPENFRRFSDVLHVVYGSMGAGDLIIYTDKPDTQASRRYFDFSPETGSPILSPNLSFILELMNIPGEFYKVEMGYDEQERMRYVRIRLGVALTIKFKFEDGERKVDLEKGSTILLLRVWHLTALEVISEFEKAGFMLLQSSMTKDREYLLTISGVDA